MGKEKIIVSILIVIGITLSTFSDHIYSVCLRKIRRGLKTRAYLGRSFNLRTVIPLKFMLDVRLVTLNRQAF